jgi:hypothetical protein
MIPESNLEERGGVQNPQVGALGLKSIIVDRLRFFFSVFVYKLLEKD